MVSITTYGGAGEIGGNKILVEEKDAKIFLDFGEGFNLGEKYSYEYLKPTNCEGLEGLFEFDLMPRIPRVFSKKYLMLTDMKYEKPDIDGIFVSHSHSDHVGHLYYIDESIPIYVGHGTHLLMDLYHAIYGSLYDIGKTHAFEHFKTGDRVKIKHMTVEPVHVDHSVPGAYGFIVSTKSGNIAYTGDLRLHGPRADMTQEFIDKAKKAKPRALLVEGTNMSQTSDVRYTEETVKARIDELVSNAKGMIFAYFPTTNIDRFMTFYNIAKKNKRTLVIDFNIAHFIYNFRQKVPSLPDVMADNNIRIYYRPRSSCTFCEDDYNYKYYADYYQNRIIYSDIQKSPKKYIMHVSFNRLTDLVYIKPKEADFIYSSSEHFYEGDDNEEQRKVWEAWMEHYNITFHKAHCSGHMARNDIIKMIETIDPEILIPIHTDVPEQFKSYHDNVVLPKKEGTITL